MKLKNPIKKGIWWYEMQILMIVFMWQHDLTHNPAHSEKSLRWGRLYIWYDSDWFYRFQWARPLYAASREIKKFVHSMRAYLRLYRAGFIISNSGSSVSGFEINRFFWKNKMIREMPDIDCVEGKYSTVFNGRTTPLN